MKGQTGLCIKNHYLIIAQSLYDEVINLSLEKLTLETIEDQNVFSWENKSDPCWQNELEVAEGQTETWSSKVGIG